MVLGAINLFPYTLLWRIGHEPYHSHKCNICITIAILLIIGAILIERLVSVLAR